MLQPPVEPTVVSGHSWLAEREADLLPVGYFHVVFTLPAEVADIAFYNKALVYDLLFKAAAETMTTIAADLSSTLYLLGSEAQRLCHADETREWDYLRFSVRRRV